ncbi:MAG: type II toxin-antitoxin system RelE/ParE family toxin [Myxococcota bacterium]
MTDRGSADGKPTGHLIRWTPSAFRDLQNAYEYVRENDPKAARELARGIRLATRQVADQPESGPVAQDLQPVGAYRHVVVRPYRIIYLVDQEAVVVLRIWDSRRDPDELSVR